MPEFLIRFLAKLISKRWFQFVTAKLHKSIDWILFSSNLMMYEVHKFSIYSLGQLER